MFNLNSYVENISMKMKQKEKHFENLIIQINNFGINNCGTQIQNMGAHSIKNAGTQMVNIGMQIPNIPITCIKYKSTNPKIVNNYSKYINSIIKFKWECRI